MAIGYIIGLQVGCRIPRLRILYVTHNAVVYRKRPENDKLFFDL